MPAREIKLLTILKTFSKEELKEFEKFIISPFHNKGRNFKPLLGLLKKLYPDFPADKLTSEKIYKKLYPGKIYDRSRSSLTIRVLFSQLTQLAEDFMLIKELYNDENTLVRNNLKFKVNFTNKSLNIFAEKPLIDNLKLLEDYIETFKESNLHVLTNENLVQLKVMNADYETVLDLREQNILYALNSAFDQIYFTVASNLVLIQRINRGLNGVNFYKHILNNIDPELLENFVYNDKKGTKNIIIFNYYVSRFILNNDFEDLKLIDKIIDFYKEIFPSLSFENKHSLFVRLSNILIMGSHIDTELFGYKIHILSEYILKYNCYSEKEDEMMSGMSYMNIFVNKEYFLNAEEIKQFISDNIKYVHKRDREYTEKISEICYCIKSGKYEDGLKMLSRINTNETLYKIIIYRYKLMLLYEMKMFEELISNIDSFEHFLRNNRLINNFMSSMYLTLCKALKLLIKINLNPENIITNELETSVENCKNKVFYRWVKQKADEIVRK
ncbi:MAG: hypothetical protein J0M37_04815 [Ignavibacteria bacterium]|nr:hypothetical protein [Ignavibacteria bacterium]